MKFNLKSLSRNELSQKLVELDIEKYRSKQIFNWVYQKGITDFSLMTNIKKEKRTFLNNIFSIPNLKIHEKKVSSDNTVKYLFKLSDNQYIESVFIPGSSKNTICISSQIGCKMGCTFCQTANMGFIRNLTPFEITDQIYQVRMDTENTPLFHTNIVFMGMGEPFDNFENVVKAVKIMNDNEGFQIGLRRITVSTCGIVPKIYEAAELEMNFGLAISLNAADNELRNRLMPINKKYPIEELMKSADYFFHRTGRRVTFEYIVFPGINDSDKDIKNLGKITFNTKCKINLISYNETKGQFKRIDEFEIEKFREKLANEIKHTVTVRKSRGGDIEAACGQLYAKYKLNKNERSRL